MKTIEYSYGLDLSWIEPFVGQLSGKVEGSFIVAPEEISTGTSYFLDCGEEVIVLYVDLVYNTDVHFVQKNLKKDFVGFYYNLTEGDAVKSANNTFYTVGHLGYNMSIIDSELETNYYVKDGSSSFELCIFISKKRIESFVKRNKSFLEHIEKIMDPEKNTFIKFDRMSNECHRIISDLRKMEVGKGAFDLYLASAAHLLVSDYLTQMLHDTIIIEKVDKDDLLSIIEVQTFLIDGVEGFFPSINVIAGKANMSDSKFKKLFKKITGKTPNSYFMENKLIKAKKLIEEKELSISEVSERLNFSSHSYFSSQFKEYFGIAPKVFIQNI